MWDLRRPERFYYLLTRANRRSWLVKGAVVLGAYAAVCAAWFVAGLVGAGGALQVLAAPAALLAAATAGYTAFLFGQCEGRDLWQSPLLLPTLLAQAVVAGGAAYAVLDLAADVPSPEAVRWVLLGGLAATALLVAAELAGHRTAHVSAAVAAMTRGRYARRFWAGGVVLGLAVPAALVAVGLATGTGPWPAAAGRDLRRGRHVVLRGQLRAGGPVRAAVLDGDLIVTELHSYPPQETWHDVTSLDAKAWPNRVENHHTLVPTTCFNCEAACGLLCHVNHATGRIDRIEGNPLHPASRGRNCAKGPATLNQIDDHERILYPLRRAGERGSGQWERVSWDEALDDIGGRIRTAIAEGRGNEVMYHVGRPGEDGYAERVLQCWGVDGHNSHTNICSSNARIGYQSWMGHDRPSSDFANAEVIFLISSHLESGPLLQPARPADHRGAGARARRSSASTPGSPTPAPRPTTGCRRGPGTEPFLLLAIARLLLLNGTWERDFVRRWCNWEVYLRERHPQRPVEFDSVGPAPGGGLRRLHARRGRTGLRRGGGGDSTEIARDHRRPSHEIRLPTTGGPRGAGNLGGWQTARCLFSPQRADRFGGHRGGHNRQRLEQVQGTPTRPAAPPPGQWNELNWPPEYPLAYHEMSILLPHFLAEERGRLEVYFSRVYNPVWTKPRRVQLAGGAQRPRQGGLPRGAHAHLVRDRRLRRLRAAHGGGGRAPRRGQLRDPRRALDRLPPAGAAPLRRDPRRVRDPRVAQRTSSTPARCGRRTSSGSTCRGASTRTARWASAAGSRAPPSPERR